MLNSIFTALKVIATVIVVVAILIASFYTAYVILVIVVVAIVGSLAYLYFSRDKVVDWFDMDE